MQEQEGIEDMFNQQCKLLANNLITFMETFAKFFTKVEEIYGNGVIVRC